METRKIGALAVSVVGLGCNNFGGRLDQERTSLVIDAALEAGISVRRWAEPAAQPAGLNSSAALLRQSSF